MSTNIEGLGHSRSASHAVPPQYSYASTGGAAYGSTSPSAKSVDVAIGIDLGSANTCTAIFRNDKVDIVPHEGQHLMPTCVAFTPTNRLVGLAAKRQAGSNPKNTILNFLGFIGGDYANPRVQSLIKESWTEVRNKDGKPMFAVRCQDEVLLFSPMEILAMILARARRDAQQFLGQGYNVAHPVITVPASFGSMQRQIIGDAASVAKLNSLRVISAVAYTLMDYAMTNWSSEIRNVLCVDFGAASLDVAIANVEEGVVEIKATDCEDLGGKDIDNCLVHYLVKTLKIPLEGNVTRPLCRLRVAAEKAKRELSSQQQTRVELDALIGDQSFTCLLTRQELESYGFSFHGGCVEPMQRVLQASRLTKDYINTVIVTGGSSRIPRFLTTISQFMAQSAISRCVNADEAAARGAAMHAAMLAGDKSRRLMELLLLDTTPLSIGIEASGGRMTTLYKKNTLTGIAKTIDLAIPTLRDGSAAMRVFEGEWRSANDNILIGKLYLNFASVLAGCVPDCELSVRHQEQNNTFSFTARDKSSGKLVGLLFVPVPDRLSKDDLQALLAKSERFDAIEASEERRISARNALEDYVVKLLNNAIKEPDSELSRRKETIGNGTLQWLDEYQQASEAEIHTQLARIQETLRSLTSVGERHNPARSIGPHEAVDLSAEVQDSLASIAVAGIMGDEKNVEHQDDCSAPTPKIQRASVPAPLLTSTQIVPIDASGAGSAQLGPAGLVAESGVENSVPSPSAGSTYSDTEITQISTMLRNTGRPSWSLVPRLYTVLRLISQLDALDDFIEQGMTDIWLPFTQKSLPPTLSPTARAQFLQHQDKVLSKSLLFEKSSDRKHAHFAQGEPLPFQVVAKLGAGAHAHVDKVMSVVSHREFARKLFRRQRGFAKDAVKSFLVELQILKRVQHYHCVELMYSYTDPKYFALLMAPVADCNLNEYYHLALESPDKRSLLRSFLGCLAHALDYVHGIRIRHRDIKPHNILVKNDRVLLTDFGIALDWENLSRSTTTADSGKTWVYAAPEVARYEKRNSSADVWSLGCVFMEIVTTLKGEPIAAMRAFFEQGTGNHRFYANTALLPQWAKHLRTIAPDKDDIVFKWVRGMLEEDADERPTAVMLYADIVKECRAQNVPFCGSCCVEGADSSGVEDEGEDDLWEKAADLTIIPGKS